MRLARLWRKFAAVSVAGLIATACPGGTNVSSTPPRLGQAVVKGGRIVLAAQEYPECLNVLTECADIQWLYWSVVQFVMPRATQLTTDGRFTNSPLITEFPSLSNGDLTQSPFTVRYRINAKAVLKCVPTRIG